MLERALAHLEKNGMQREALVLAWLLLLLLRWVVGLHAYSGAATPPMFGDFEAQRHWMEVTLHLPVSQWYFNTTSNDLLYWGLDYPPLTAFVSYAFGALAHRIEPAMVALTTSRGYESPTSKVFMRTTVILCDLVVFLPVVFYVARVLYKRQQWTQRIALPLLVLSQPALLLIDHGHFQVHPCARTRLLRWTRDTDTSVLHSPAGSTTTSRSDSRRSQSRSSCANTSSSAASRSAWRSTLSKWRCTLRRQSACSSLRAACTARASCCV